MADKIDSKNRLMTGLMGIYPDGWDGLDPKKPTPNSYAELAGAVKDGFPVPTEQELIDGIAAVDTMRASAAAKRQADETEVLGKLKINKADLEKLKQVLGR